MNLSNQNKILTIILVILVVTSVGASIGVIIWYIKYDSIFVAKYEILGDNDFKQKYNFPGSGTINDPYIIAGLNIKTKRNFGILIKDTTKCFVIKDNIILSKTSGIFIYNISINTSKILNNNIQSYNGLEMYYVSGILVENNVLTARGTAIEITGCINSTIQFNHCCKAYNGIILTGPLNNSIIANNICNYNSQCGIRTNFYDPMKDEYIFSKNVIFQNNSCLYNGEIGLLASGGFYSTIRYNNCSFNYENGIVYGGDNSSIIGNYCKNNTLGLNIQHTRYSIIVNNTLIDNINYGIKIWYWCGQNIIYHNNFINNFPNGTSIGYSQACDDYSIGGSFGKNIWYNNETLSGNFWSDLIWSPGITYEIDGSDCVDLYPLEYPIELVLPTNENE